ncbi:MAG TPA: metal ABC transporter permease, partial [Actinomycetota bacterium]
FKSTMRWSVAIGVASSIAGLAASRIWNLAPGGTIVLITAGTFMAIALLTRRRGRSATVPEPGDPGHLAEDLGPGEATV